MTLETLHNTSLGEKIKVRNNMQGMIPLKVKTLLTNISINVLIHVCILEGYSQTVDRGIIWEWSEQGKIVVRVGEREGRGFCF